MDTCAKSDAYEISIKQEFDAAEKLRKEMECDATDATFACKERKRDKKVTFNLPYEIWPLVSYFA